MLYKTEQGFEGKKTKAIPDDKPNVKQQRSSVALQLSKV